MWQLKHRPLKPPPQKSIGKAFVSPPFLGGELVVSGTGADCGKPWIIRRVGKTLLKVNPKKGG